MFNKNKKQVADNSKAKAAEVAKQLEEINKEIAIHTMPKKFRLDRSQLKKSKTTGIIIMVVGFVFIVVLGFLIYWFAFRTTPAEDNLSLNQEQNQAEFIPLEDNESDESDLEDNSDNVLPGSGVNLGQNDLATSTEEVVEPIATSTPEIATDEIDSDNDGLTDKEEILLGTEIDRTDSDNDSFFDLSEMQNGYNPAGPGKLVDNPNIGEYVNTGFNYSLLYPVSWTRNSIGGDDSIMFRSEDNSFVQIIAQPNIDQEAIADWYQRQFSSEIVATDKIIINQNWQGVKNEDGTIIYLTDNDRHYIFVLSYSPGPDEVLYYENIFAVMIDSFAIGLST